MRAIPAESYTGQAAAYYGMPRGTPGLVPYFSTSRTTAPRYFSPGPSGPFEMPASSRKRRSTVKRKRNPFKEVKRRTKRFVSAKGRKSVNWKGEAVDSLLESLGGVASAAVDGVTELTATKYDNNLLLRGGTKTVVRGVLNWLAGGNKTVKSITAGWQGDTAGSSVREVARRAGGK